MKMAAVLPSNKGCPNREDLESVDEDIDTI